MKHYLLTLMAMLLWLPGSLANEAARLVVGSKNFNENYILGEIVAQHLENHGFSVERKFGLGGTLICFAALENGEIDAYVEYTGTVSEVILADQQLQNGSEDLQDLNARLANRGLELLPSLGFNNTYALAMRRSLAEELGISSISQAMRHTDLKLAFSHEFLRREDGWPGLQKKYRTKLLARGIEHGLAYQALKEGNIDLTDAYSTDGELNRYDLTILRDDRNYFPHYFAVPFVRLDLPGKARAALLELGSSLDEDSMQKLNEAVVFQGLSFSQVASGFLSSDIRTPLQDVLPNGAEKELPRASNDDSEQLGTVSTPTGTEYDASLHRTEILYDILGNTATHLKLTGIALFASVTTGIVLSLLVYRLTWLSRSVIYVAGLLQTIPSIALLALMIPLFGIGQVPAVIALFFYSLLPVIRNTITALVHVDPLLKRVAVAIGLEARERLRYVYLPLALPNIISGIRTATVISIGTATLAAFIGAGGLGDPIVTGLALNDTALILQGAIPAAILALLAELLFELVEKIFLTRYFLANHSS